METTTDSFENIHWNTSIKNVELQLVVTEIDRTSEIIFHAILFFIGPVANALIIATIAKFNTLKTARNILVMHWAITDMLFLLSTPQTWDLVLHLTVQEVYTPFFFTIFTARAWIHSYEIILVGMLFLNTTYKRLTVENLRKIIPLMWVIFFMITTVSVIESYFFRDYFSFFIYGCVALSSIVIFLVKISLFVKNRFQRKPFRYQVRLILTTGYVGCWSLVLVSLVIVAAVNFKRIDSLMKLLTIALAVAHCHCFVQLGLLVMFDLDFRNCFLKMLRREEIISHDSLVYSKNDDIEPTENV